MSRITQTRSHVILRLKDKAWLWFDAANRMGIFEPVACHQNYQRRGLASAVMTEGLRRLAALGAHVVHVNSWREDSAGATLYWSLGFAVTGRIYAWEKQV